MSKEGSFIQGKYSCSLNVSNIENNSLNVNSGPPKKPVGGLKKNCVPFWNIQTAASIDLLYNFS